MAEGKGPLALVTGAAGFIGSHLVEDLVEAGWRVRAFVRYNSRSDIGNLRLLPKETLEKVHVFAGDLKDPTAVDRAVEGADTVFHLGALIAIPYSYINPVDFVQTNVTGTIHMLEAARRHRVRRVVHTSTSETYGTALYAPIDEAHPMQGQSPYSASKIGADKMAESFWHAFGLPVTTIRPFNTYGPRQSARAVIPTIAVQALTGDVIRLGSLAPTRDLNFVKDITRGFRLAAEKEAAVGETINLGTGKEISIGELAEIVMEITGGGKRVVVEEKRVRPEKSEVMRLVADASRAEKLLGWKPEVPIREGLGRTVAWVRENLGRFHDVGNYVV
ncbi:MAG: SDR family NAD(P)-dependent oxidoreductase [Candidatus Eisenbacteria bacterium]